MAALLRWTTAMLVFLLSTEDTSAAIDPQRLSVIVNGIKRQYGVEGMFSLAVSVPDNQDQNINQIIQQVITSDPPNNVKNKINNGEVYIGSRMVAAKVLKHESGGADHAEARVVSYLNQLIESPEFNQNDLMLFYVFASPCVEKCTNNEHTENILQKIELIQRWTNHAVVFSKIFKPSSGFSNTEEERSRALRQLGTAVGQNNIFRCDRQRCNSCFSDNNYINCYCVSDETQTDTGQSNSMSIQPSPQHGSFVSSGLNEGRSNFISGRGRGNNNRGRASCRGNNRRGKRSVGGNDDSDSDNCVLSPQNGKVDEGDSKGKGRKRKGLSKGKGRNRKGLSRSKGRNRKGLSRSKGRNRKGLSKGKGRTRKGLSRSQNQKGKRGRKGKRSKSRGGGRWG